MTNSLNINKLLVGIVDILIFIASFVLTYLLKFGLDVPDRNFQALVFMLPWFVIVFIFFSNIYDLYSEYVKLGEKAISLIITVALASVANIALSYLLAQYAVPRTVFLVSAPLQVLLLGSWRYYVCYRGLLIRNPRKAIVIGNPQEVSGLLESINANLDRGLNIVHRLDVKDNFQMIWNNFKSNIVADGIEVIILCSSIQENDRRLVLDYCIRNNKALMVVPNIYDIFLQKARMVSAGDTPIIQVKEMGMNSVSQAIKRSGDIILAFIGSVLTLPLNILIALAIKLDSPGPVLYSQERTGLKGRSFVLYKFRTMVSDAEKKTGPVLASEQDPRVTRVGRFLRQVRLDEIPQFFNVLRGDMSLVGPRPERPYFVEEFKERLPQFNYRHEVKVGLTGLAQVEGRYSTDPANKLYYDLLYARHASLGLDIVILLRTAKVLFLKNKAC